MLFSSHPTLTSATFALPANCLGVFLSLSSWSPLVPVLVGAFVSAFYSLSETSMSVVSAAAEKLESPQLGMPLC